MHIKHEDFKYGLPDIEALSKGSFDFNGGIPVSSTSTFNDTVWDWQDKNNERLRHLAPSHLVINWNKYTIGTSECNEQKANNTQFFVPQLPLEMIEDVKRAFFIYLLFPFLIGDRGKQRSQGIKINTLISHLRVTLNFFSYIYLENLLQSGIPRIRKMSDISIEDIKKAIKTYPYGKGRYLRDILTILSSDTVKENLKFGRVRWNKHDIISLRWENVSSSESEERNKSLPSDLFILMTSKSRNILGEFLCALNEKVIDEQAANFTESFLKIKNFKEVFVSYTEKRENNISKGTSWESHQNEILRRKYKISIEDLRTYLKNVQAAAQIIILLYTGMRYSDTTSLKKGCLRETNEGWIVKGTVIKGIPVNNPTQEDEWVAIPLVRDAVRAIEILSACTLNDYIFSGFTINKKQGARPYAKAGLTKQLKNFLKFIDSGKHWADWKLCPKQFRHGLIYQLSRAGVGFHYLTRQLHHFSTRIFEASNVVNQTTTVYGMQKERLLGTATYIETTKEANLEIFKGLFSEDAEFAGGGAEIHKKRSEGFFRGMGLEGEAREEYIRKMAESGITPVRTGIGWCTRNHINSPINEDPPPCIGDLNCNPHTCKHSVVPKSRLSDIKRHFFHAVKMLADPDQQFRREYWKATYDSYGAMLRNFGIDLNELINTPQ